ncbi:MAG: ABC transporter permease [Saprospiraceae bacterium]|nr:ABC transporter permease [Saprospiraceae bacterium]
MLRNYFLVAWRNLIKQRLYSGINLLGLTLGTAIVILLFSQVWDEWTFDRFHAKSDRIYRAWVKEHYKGDVFFNTVTPYILGPALKDGFPEIEEVVRYLTFPAQIKQGEFADGERIHVAEPGFLNVFDFPLKQGDPSRALSGIHNVVLTEKTAEKYFGQENAMGQNLQILVDGAWTNFTVSGVSENPPNTSSIQFDFLVPFELTKTIMSEGGRTSWTNVNVETYVLLNKDADIAEFEKKLGPFADAQVADIYQPGEYEIGLQPLTDIHLDDAFPEGIVSVSNARYPAILAIIAVLILLLAGINYTTLAVGRSLSRAKEVGIRKSTGAQRMQLMAQYWIESLLTSSIAVLAGFFLAKILLPGFNFLADKQLELHFDLKSGLFLAGLIAITGMLAGVYPALVVSGFKPLYALQGMAGHAKQNKYTTLKILVIGQFSLSILLIICTWTMFYQLRFMQNKDLGYSQDQVLIVPYSVSGMGLADQVEAGKGLCQRMASALEPGGKIKAVALSTHTFGTPGWGNIGYTDQETQKFRSFYLNGINDQFLPMMQIKLSEGHNFTGEEAGDKHSVIVNEAFVKEFGLKDPIGGPLQEPFQEYKVIGIVNDFNFESLHSAVHPLVLAADPVGMIRTASDVGFVDYPNPKLSFKISGGDINGALTQIENAWKEMVPDQVFSYSFMDDNIDRLYRADHRLGRILFLATLLAIFIACLGLFGITTLMISQRMKEIGVRKVLGASTGQILVLLNKPITYLILISSLVAIPLAWYLMNRWLNNFAFRIDPSTWIMIGAGLSAMALALLTVSWQSIKASLMNPIHSIRNE